MIVSPSWTGLLQAAFKHQNIVHGVSDVYYLRRPDIELPKPPITTIDVPYDVVPNLRDVYGIDAAGDLYVLGPTDHVATLGDRRVVTLGSVGHGDAADEEALEVHELGAFFQGNISLAPDGRIVAVSNSPSFYVFAPNGEQLISHHSIRAGLRGFERPEAGAPFWEVGAADVAAGHEGFLVGGGPIRRVDYYTWDGRLRCSIRRFEHGGTAWDLEREGVSKVCFDRRGRLLASSTTHVFVFDQDGRIVEVLVADRAAGGAADFHLWIGVDRDEKLWSQFYKGKEVAYAAFPLAVVAG